MKKAAKWWRYLLGMGGGGAGKGMWAEHIKPGLIGGTAWMVPSLALEWFGSRGGGAAPAAAAAAPSRAGYMTPGYQGVLGMHKFMSADLDKRPAFEITLDKHCERAGIKKEAIAPLLAAAGRFAIPMALSYGLDYLMRRGMGPRARSMPGRGVTPGTMLPRTRLPSSRLPFHRGFGGVYGMHKLMSSNDDKRLAFEVGVEKFCKEAGMDEDDTADMLLMAKTAFNPWAEAGHTVLKMFPGGGAASALARGVGTLSGGTANVTGPETELDMAGKEWAQRQHDWGRTFSDVGLTGQTGRTMAKVFGGLETLWKDPYALVSSRGRRGYERGLGEAKARAAKDEATARRIENINRQAKNISDPAARAKFVHEQRSAIGKEQGEEAYIKAMGLLSQQAGDLYRPVAGETEAQRQARLGQKARWLARKLPGSQIQNLNRVRSMLGISGPAGGSAAAGATPPSMAPGRQPTPPVMSTQPSAPAPGQAAAQPPAAQARMDEARQMGMGAQAVQQAGRVSEPPSARQYPGERHEPFTEEEMRQQAPLSEDTSGVVS